MKLITTLLLLMMILISGCGPNAGRAGYAVVEGEDVVAAEGIRVDSQADSSSRKRAKPKREGDEEWLTHFELTERSGEQVRSEDLRGQPYVVGFFFTLCPSICVNQNGKVQELQEKYRGKPVRFLSISCDPEMDRPKVLAEYAERFNADKDQWLFLTGDMDYITRVAGEMYMLAASRRFHAEKFVLVDGNGENYGFYSWADPVQFKALQKDIDKLIAAGGSLDDSQNKEQSTHE